MSTPSIYLLRTEILVSFKFPVDLTLNLLKNQPLHQFHYGLRYNLSGLDYGKGPGIDITASAQHLTPPQIKIYSPSSHHSGPFKRPSLIICLLYSKGWAPFSLRVEAQVLQRPTSPCTTWLPIPTYLSSAFPLLLLCSLHHSQISLCCPQMRPVHSCL